MAYVNLREYIEVLEAGKRPKGGAVNEGVPSLGGEHITNTGKFNLSNDKLKYVPREYYDELKKGKIKINDVLVVKDGATTGKTAIVEDDFLLKEACINEHVFLLRTKDSLNPKYLFYYFLSEQGQQEILKDFRGATVGGISKDFIDMDIYISDLDTQKKIVEVLDKAQELIDKRKEQIKALDELVKSRFIEMFGDPVRNPKGWKIEKLENISSVGSSKRVFVDELVDEGIPFYRGTEIGALSTGEHIQPTLFITKEHYNSLKESTGVPVIGDLLMPSICPDGRIWIVKDNQPFYFKDGRVLWIHLEEKNINSIYLKHMLREKFIRDYNKIASGTTFAELKIFALKGLDISIPPIELQNQFADFVNQIDKLKSQMETSLKELEDNFDSLMQKAFKGELF